MRIYDYVPEERIDEAAIQGYISEFEQVKAQELKIPDFRLEEKQKEAVMLLNSNIMAIYGSAGTGKTTTINTIIKSINTFFRKIFS